MGQQGMAFYGVSCNESLSFIWDLEILENFKTCNLISSKHFFLPQYADLKFLPSVLRGLFNNPITVLHCSKSSALSH